MEKENGTELWNKVMAGALSIPGVKVNRTNFLSKELKNYCDDEKLKLAIEKMPSDAVSMEVIDNIANACIRNHSILVTSASFIVGIPGGWALAGTIPTDMAQYYYHVFVLSQKLAYLYGYPDLCDDEGNITEDAQGVLTLFVGAMMGVAAANEAINKIAKNLAQQVVKRLPQMALAKGTFYPLVKQVAKWIGISLNKSIFAKGVSKIIPVLGGFLSGTLSLATFLPSAKKLRKTLRDNAALFASGTQDSNNEYTTYEDVSDKDNIAKQLLIVLINMAKVDFNVSPEEEEYIAKQIEESGLEENDKMEFINILHSKDMADADLSAFKDNSQYAIALMTKLVEVAKADNVVKPEERIYLFKIGKELGFDKEDVLDMLK